MARYLVQRLILAVPTVLGLTVLLFTFLHLAVPTDAIDLMLAGAGQSGTELAQQLKREWGLTDPLPLQYLRWISGLLHGDLGISIVTRRPVAQDLLYRLPASFELGLGALIISTVIAIPIGVLSATQQDRWPDYVFRSTAILFNAAPGFWLATLVLTLGSVWFHWAPPLTYYSFFVDPVANIKIMIAPMILLGLAPIGAMIRLMRTQLLDVLREDYIRTARAKGLPSSTVYYRHAMRNALLPVVTFVGSRVPIIISGTVIFESIFSIPGVGSYLFNAIGSLDYPVILTVDLFIAVAVVLTNLFVDLSYAWLDPRVRY